jgi:MFS transporter, ACDE family, multidrug resistance protein
MTTVDTRDISIGRPPLWFIYSVTIAGILSNSVITPNIPDVLADLGQSTSRAGILVAASPLPGIVMAPIVGVLADRFGRRRVLLPCLVAFGIAAVLASVAPTFELLLGARFLQGVGGAGLINLAVVLIGDHWEGIERTKLIGRNSAVLTICLALVPSISGVVAEVSSWRYSLAIGTLALPIAFVGWRVLPDIRPGGTRSVGDQLRGAASVLRQPEVVTILASGVLLFTVIFGVFLTALPVHLEDEFGLSAGPRGLVLSSFSVGASFAAFNLGWIRSKVGARPLLVSSCLLIALSAAAIGLAPTIALVVLASLFYGLGDGSAIPALQDLMTSAAPAEQRASAIAAWVSGVRLGQTIGPIGAAALFAATSTQTTMLVGAGIFGLLALLMMVAPLTGAPVEES